MSKDEPTPGQSDTNKDPATSEAPALSRKRESSWPSVLFYIHLNILGLYGVAVLFTNTYFTTIVFTVFLSLIGIVGVTTGAHRLWAHRSYTASPLLRVILMLCQTMAGQVGLMFENIMLYAQHEFAIGSDARVAFHFRSEALKYVNC